MANENAVHDDNRVPSMLIEVGGETRRISDKNPLPVDDAPFNTQGVETTGIGSQNFLTPAPGKRLRIKGVLIRGQAFNQSCSLEFQTSSLVVFKTFAAGFEGDQEEVNVLGGVDEPLTAVNNGNNQQAFFSVNYTEE